MLAPYDWIVNMPHPAKVRYMAKDFYGPQWVYIEYHVDALLGTAKSIASPLWVS